MMSWVVMKLELDGGTARFGRPTLWANAVLDEPPRFPGAIATRPFFIPEHLMEVARGIAVGDEVDIGFLRVEGWFSAVEGMVDLSLRRKGPVDWRRYPRPPEES